MMNSTVNHIYYRLFIHLVIAMLLIPAAALATEYVSVSKDGVNIRANPETKAEVLWEVPKDFPLEVLQHKDSWAQVQDFEGDKGWVYAPLLTKQKTVIIKVQSANLRVGPGTSYEVVASAKHGVIFKPEKRDGEWLKVSHADGTVGWLHQNLFWPSSP